MSADKLDHFWLVWNEQGDPPKLKHATLENAKREAGRLATLNPGQQFHVLQVIATARFARVEWLEYDYAPF